MDISALNAANSTYGVANQSAKVANYVQSNNTTQAQQSDTVSISQEATQKNREERYALKDDPIEIFNQWKSEGRDFPIIGYEPKPFEDLLPENQELINKLRNQAKNMPTEEDRRLIEADISTISSYGDKEIFSSREDVSKRLMTESQAATLQMRYLIEKNKGESIFKSNQGYEIPTRTRESIQQAQPRGLNEEGLLANQNPKFEVSSIKQFSDKVFLKDMLNFIYGQDSFYAKTKF